MVRQTTAPADCAPYLHIITVRGTCAVYGQDNFQGLVPDIQARISGVNAIGLPYPANGDPARCPASYENSVNQGTTLLTQYIRDYASSCPKSKIGLIGYSQGAQVVMDTLCGTTEQPGRFTPTNPLPDNLASRISVAAVVADTTYIDGQGYDVGTAKNNGRNGVRDAPKGMKLLDTLTRLTRDSAAAETSRLARSISAGCSLGVR